MLHFIEVRRTGKIVKRGVLCNLGQFLESAFPGTRTGFVRFVVLIRYRWSVDSNAVLHRRGVPMYCRVTDYHLRQELYFTKENMFLLKSDIRELGC